MRPAGSRGSSSISISTTHSRVPSSRQPRHDLAPLRGRLPQQGLDAAAIVLREPEPLRPAAFAEPRGHRPRMRARGGVGEAHLPRGVDEQDAGALDVEDREEVVVAAAQRPIEAIAMERDLDRGTQVALVERLDDVAVRRGRLRALDRRRDRRTR